MLSGTTTTRGRKDKEDAAPVNRGPRRSCAEDVVRDHTSRRAPSPVVRVVAFVIVVVSTRQFIAIFLGLS
jgi:hypothetical protein